MLWVYKAATRFVQRNQINTFRKHFTMYTKDDCVCFWKTNQPYGWASQWYASSFRGDIELHKGKGKQTVTFPGAEHWMMAHKAILFGDHAVARKVMESQGVSSGDMRYVKQLGREVSNFNEKLWIQERDRIVLEGNLLKFRQNEDLKTKLMATGDKHIVEASPLDSIWGIGLAEDSAFGSSKKWGLNLLGKALVETRRILSEEKAQQAGEQT